MTAKLNRLEALNVGSSCLTALGLLTHIVPQFDGFRTRVASARDHVSCRDAVFPEMSIIATSKGMWRDGLWTVIRSIVCLRCQACLRILSDWALFTN